MVEEVFVGWNWEDYVIDIRILWVVRLVCKSFLFCVQGFFFF